MVALVVPAAALGAGPGAQLDYAYAAGSVLVNVASAQSSSTASTVLAGASVTYDGSTQVLVRFNTGRVTTSGANDAPMIAGLYEDGTFLTQLCWVGQPSGYAGACAGAWELTPTAGAHTFTVKAWDSRGTDSGNSGFYLMSLSVTQVSGTWAGGGGTDDDSAYATTAQVNALTLNSLANVTAGSPSNGDVLTYNTTLGKWTNLPDSDSGGGVAGASCGGAGEDPCSVNVDTSSNGGAALVDVRHLAGWLVGLTICALCLPLIAAVINRGGSP